MMVQAIAYTIFHPCFRAWCWLIRSHAQKEPLRDRTNTSFKYGEQLTYRIHYGFVDAATATLKIDNNPKVIGGRNSYHM